MKSTFEPDRTAVPRLYDSIELRLRPPRSTARLVKRLELIERINQGAAIVFVRAPAGHGKSVLLQQAFAECGRLRQAVGWITLRSSENDVAALGRLMNASLNKLWLASEPIARGIIPFRNHGAGPCSVENVIERLLALDAPVTLFVDDFQTLHTQQALDFFRDLLTLLPPRVRLIVASRTEPAIGLSKLVVAGQVDVIDASDLRLTPGEVADVLSGLEPYQPDIERVHRETEGWPAVVQLYRLAYLHGEACGSGTAASFEPSRLAEYLLENVLSVQSEELQSFLIETAPLTRLCAAICQAITGRDANKLLATLESAGLLTRGLEGGEEWFRLPAMLAKCLRAQLNLRFPGRARQIHVVASQWFREHGHMGEALAHALDAHEFVLAADCLECWAAELIMQGKLTLVVDWFEKLPPHTTRCRPRLLTEVAWALAFLRRRHRLQQILAMLEENQESMNAAERCRHSVLRSMICILHDDIAGAQRYAEPFDPEIGSDAFSIFEAGATANLKGHLSLLSGELELARDYLVIGRTCGNKVRSSFSLFGSMATATVNLIVQGRLREALEFSSDTRTDGEADSGVSSRALHASRIHALYEANRLEEARALFDQSFSAISGCAQVDFIAIACNSMVRIFDACQQPARANALIDEVQGIALTESLPRLADILARERVRRCTLAGDLNRAHSIAARIDESSRTVPEGWIPFSEETEGAVICHARLAIHENRLHEAHRLIAPTLGMAANQGRVYRQIKLLILFAMTQYRAGHTLDAFRRMRKAVQLAASGGYVRTFLDEGPLCLEILRHAHDGGELTSAEAQHVRLLLDMPTALSGAATVPVTVSEPLSVREEEILRLLSRGMCNREIGTKLYISENTVKYHLKNIYSKLGVRNRSQAIKSVGALELT